MTDKNVDKTGSGKASDFLKKLKDFALVVGEECPEGHRRDPGSGACLPMSGIDHTAFTRSLNDEQGPEWRGELDKPNVTFDSDRQYASRTERAVDANLMDERQSCAAGTTFSFIQSKCVALEEAEAENNDQAAMTEEGTYIEVSDHQQVIDADPEGRKDTVNFQCPPDQFFDHKRRECIPLNKDTVMASDEFSDEFKKVVATYARLAVTSPDPMDGHRHVASLDEEGNGVTSISGYSYTHSHQVKKFNVSPTTVEKNGESYTSQHPGVAVPVEMHLEKMDDYGSDKEGAKELDTSTRKSLPDSAFGVPGKRKFPLDTCSRVRNAMARFNQAKGLTPAEKSTLRRKILARAKACDIKVDQFAKAETDDDFKTAMEQLMPTKERVTRTYAEDMKKGPCPPGMTWSASNKKCEKARGFIATVLEKSNHEDVIANDPEGRRDPKGFQCPPNQLFDFKRRECIPLNKDTVMASEEDAAKRDLSPLPEGKPARLPLDCPAGTIWDGDLRKCKPLDSRKKTKSSDEDAAAPASGPGKNKDSDGCGPGEFLNPITKKCMPRKGAFKGKSEVEAAENSMPGNREGLTDEVPGKVKLPSDCPAGTIWDGTRRTCTPLSSMDKNRPSGSSGPMNPKDVAHIIEIESLSLAKVISRLDEIIKEELDSGRKEKAKVSARELPNEAFPPSLISASRRALMHHTPEVSDPYDNDTVDISRLRNALARVSVVEGFAPQAIDDAEEHLLFHAREVLKSRLGKI